MTVYLPDPAKANGTAVIVAPGGGFHALSINSEGIEVAKWLTDHGIAAFVLKYRLVPTGEDGVQEFMQKVGDREKMDKASAPVIALAKADGLAAIAYVRTHAAEFGVKADRIGIVGFSAGGAVAAATAFDYTAANRPNFVAPIIRALQVVDTKKVPADAPPLFIAVASDDNFGYKYAFHETVRPMDWGEKIGRITFIQQRRTRFRDAQTKPAERSLDRSFRRVDGYAGLA